MNKLNLYCYCFLTVLMGLSIGFGALANDGMSPQLFELVQRGQDVEITLEVWKNGEPGLDDEYKFVRIGPDGEHTVFDRRVLDESDADSFEPMRCRWWESAGMDCSGGADGDTDSDTDFDPTNPYCDDCSGNGSYDCWGECEPSDTDASKLVCVPCARGGCSTDCDGDGANDCRGWCHAPYYFAVVDRCVSPGAYEYQLLYYRSSWDGGEWKVATERASWDQEEEGTSFEVIESGEPCSSDSCGCRTVGTSSGAQLFPTMLLFLSAMALVWSRRHWGGLS